MDIEKNNLIKWLFVWSFTGQLPVSKRQTVHSLLNSGEVATHAQFRSISLCSSQRATRVKPEAAGVAQVIAGQRRGLRFLEPTGQRFSLLCLTLAQTDGFHFDFISFRCDLSTGNLKDPWVFFILFYYYLLLFVLKDPWVIWTCSQVQEWHCASLASAYKVRWQNLVNPPRKEFQQPL